MAIINANKFIGGGSGYLANSRAFEGQYRVAGHTIPEDQWIDVINYSGPALLTEASINSTAHGISTSGYNHGLQMQVVIDGVTLPDVLTTSSLRTTTVTEYFISSYEVPLLAKTSLRVQVKRPVGWNGASAAYVSGDVRYQKAKEA